MFALINTFSNVEVSWHRTREAAELANDRLQIATQRTHGKDSYIPTVIRRYRYAVEGTGALTERAETKRDAMRLGAAMARGLTFGGRVIVRSPAGDAIAEWSAPPWGQGRIRRVF